MLAQRFCIIGNFKEISYDTKNPDKNFVGIFKLNTNLGNNVYGNEPQKLVDRKVDRPSRKYGNAVHRNDKAHYENTDNCRNRLDGEVGLLNAS